uniref:Rhophilin associated tail protein 1 like n=1 Tax=Macrostomum lignano TaxID=282301 RepID=A0A1I8IGZ1_9PLAT
MTRDKKEDPEDPYYCSEQIQIPPSLPDVLKQYTKSAIRTQPQDVLQWSAAYFRAMANAETPPVKERLEMAVATQKTDSGLTPGLLRVLNKQLGPKKQVEVDEIAEKWRAINLPSERLQELLQVGDFTGKVEWLKFFSVACSSLCGDLTDTMKLICEQLTADPEGGPARMNFDTWKRLYLYLYSLNQEADPEVARQPSLTWLATWNDRRVSSSRGISCTRTARLCSDWANFI